VLPAVLALVLLAMMILPLLEAVLRKTLHTNISNQANIVAHLTLIAGMIGAAIAASEGRLLSLGTVETIVPERWRPWAKLVAGAVAAAVAALLGVAAWQYVMSERQGGSTVAYGVRTWIVQLVLPLGFAAIAWHIVRRVSDRWLHRGLALAVVGAIMVLILARPLPAGGLVIPALILLGVATVLGAPIFAVLGGASLILFWGQDTPLGTLTIDHYSQVTNTTLPAVPLFTLAGYFLAEGGASRRLIRLFKALVGSLRGGPAILVALVCAFFTAFTGASGVTILALGGLLLPVLLSAGYSEKNALGLLTGSGSLGLLFPPCLPLIFYAVVASVDIRDMFLGGIVPGMVLVLLTAAWGIMVAPKGAAALGRFDAREALAALWDAKWEVLIPVVALGALFSGLATTVEAAALTAFYAFCVETFIYRDLSLRRDATRVAAESGVLVGGVLLILGVALGFTNYLAYAEIPSRAVEWVTASVDSPWLFLLYLNLFLLVVGMLMDIYSAIVIVVPLIVPLGRAFGIDPIHLGIVFLANLELGFLTPPVGQNLFLSSLRFEKPMSYVFRSVIPMVVVFLIGVALITYLPALTTTLPRLLSR
jgi:C4-dicarboxylate transporter, DctM subunit